MTLIELGLNPGEVTAWSESILDRLFIVLPREGGAPCRCSCHPRLPDSDFHDYGFSCACRLTAEERRGHTDEPRGPLELPRGRSGARASTYKSLGGPPGGCPSSAASRVSPASTSSPSKPPASAAARLRHRSTRSTSPRTTPPSHCDRTQPELPSGGAGSAQAGEEFGDVIRQQLWLFGRREVSTSPVDVPAAD
jgi:hypothetical protein